MNDSARLYFVAPDLLALQVDAGSVELGLGIDPDVFTGERLATETLFNASNYAISSTSDPLFQAPVSLAGAELYLKTKTTDVAFLNKNSRFSADFLEWAQQYTVFIQLPESTQLTSGETYTIDFTGELESEINDIEDFAYSPEQFTSEAIHIAQLGYDPDDPKLGFLSMWLGQDVNGDEAPIPEHFREGLQFWIVDATTGQRVEDDSVVRVAELSLGRGQDEDIGGTFRNFSRTDVYALDFSDFDQSGSYYIEVEGVGRSFEFEIAENTWERAFQVSMQGLYNQRSGTAIGGPYSDTEYLRSFHPDDGVLVFPTDALTTTVDGQLVSVDELQLIDTSEGFDFRGTNFREAFQNYSSPFDLDGNGRATDSELSPFITPLDDAWGGYKDAGDWDRRIQHLGGTRRLLELLERFPEYFESIDLNIPDTTDSFPTLESLNAPNPSNGLPDLLDESLWNLDFIRRLQNSDGGVRGGIESALAPKPGETSWQESRTVFAYAADPWSSYIYAGTAARAARILETYDPDLAAQYHESALRAMNWAEAELPTDEQYDVRQINDERNLAALELYLLTEDSVWHDIFLDTTVFAGEQCGPGQPCRDTFENQSHDQREAALLYARAPQQLTDATVRLNATNAILRAAENSIAVQDGGPVTIRGNALNGTVAGTAFNQTKVNSPFAPLSPGQLATPQVDNLLHAFTLTGDRRYLDAAVKGTHFSAGANPSNTVFTSGLVDAGLAQRDPINSFVIDARTTGQDTPAGITAYGPLDSSFGFVRSQQNLFGQETYPFPTQWPIYENYFDNYWNFQNTEFTIHQSIAPTAYTWGYLAASDSLAPPIATAPISNQAAVDGSTFSLDVSGNFSDSDGTITDYFALDLPPGLSIDSSGVISGVLDPDASFLNRNNGGIRDYLVTVIATDNDGANASQSFTFTVNNVAPIASDDTFSTDENTAVSGNVLTDSGIDVDGAPDSDPLIVIRNSNPANGTVEFDDNENGDFTYTPNVGFSGSDSFTYTISDSNGGSDVATVTITVVGNEPPSLTEPIADQSSSDGSEVDIDVSGNFADGDGTITSFTADGLPVGLAIDNSGLISGTIDANASDEEDDDDGTQDYTVTVTVTDDDGASSSQTFTYTVTNIAPDAADDSFAIGSGSEIVGNVLTGSGADSDGPPDTDPLTVIGNTEPTNGTVTVESNGDFSYRPDDTFGGLDSFTYTISDGNGGTDTATVTLTVISPIPNQTSADGSSITLDVSGNFADSDGISTYSATGLPAGLSIDNSGVISGDIAADASDEEDDNNGTQNYTVTVTATRVNGDSESQTFTYTIDNVLPDAVEDSFSTSEGTPIGGNVISGNIVTGLGADNDGTPDLDPLSVTNVSTPANGAVTMDAEGNFTYAPDFGFVGTDSFTYTISDGNGGTDTATVTITVEDAPILEVGLYDADTDELIGLLEDNTQVPSQLVEGRRLTIAAVVPPGSPLFNQVESVFLNFNNRQVTRTENGEPYALFGDRNGDFFAGSDIPSGDNTISFQLFSQNGRRGELLGTVVRNFTIVEEVPETLALTLDATSISEADGTAIATVTRSGDTSTDLTVNLSSSDTSEATVPETVTILAGQSSVSFEVTAVDDEVVDGTQTSTLTATAPGFIEDTATLDVTDDDVAPPVELDIGLYDADTDALIALLEDGSEILASTVDGLNLTIAAFVPDGSPLFGEVESIALDLNNGEESRVENIEPYALFGDRNGGTDLIGGGQILSSGENSIELELFSGNNQTGSLLGTVTRNFTLVDDIPSPVVNIGLYDAATDRLIGTIGDNSVIEASQFEGNLSVVAFVPDGSLFADRVESMRLTLNDGDVVRRENSEPYALFGDRNGGTDFNGGDIPVGDNTIKLDLFSANNLRGTLLTTVEREFTIV